MNNLNFFTTDISPNSIYILGFLWGDGYLAKTHTCYNIRLSNNIRDEESIKNIILKTGNWKIYPDVQNRTTFNLSDKEVHTFLSKNDYKEKSFKEPTKILNNIDKSLHFYFWLGFSDADGCWYSQYHKSRLFTVSGNYEYKWIEYCTLLSNLNINYSYRQKEQQSYRDKNKICKCSEITIRKKNDLIAWGKYLYQDSKFTGLERKYQRYIKCMSDMDYTLNTN
jgi:hypothetical protein